MTATHERVSRAHFVRIKLVFERDAKLVVQRCVNRKIKQRIYIPRANHWFVALQVNVDICLDFRKRYIPRYPSSESAFSL